MAYSSILKKKCKCSNHCLYWPSIGYAGFYSTHAPQELIDKIGNKKKVAAKNKANLNALSRKLHLEQQKVGIEVTSVRGLKSDLVAKADKLFADFIKKRDADENGITTCICCNNKFHIDEKTGGGDSVVNALHFMERTVYSLRYDERQVHAGCCYCNIDMHLHPEGVAYQQMLDKMILKVGIGNVWRMQSQKRSINKFSHSDLDEIIKKYTPKILITKPKKIKT